MQPRDFVLFSHGAFDQGITGRTALQKIVYFLSVMMDKDLGYNPHFYGPYSPKVAEANAELKELDYLEETTTVYGYNNQGFEMTKYDYSFTEDGLKLLDRKKKEFSAEWAQIINLRDRIKSAGDLSYMELAMAAKAFIILEYEGGASNKEKIKTKAKQLGWSIDDNSLENALSFLEKLELVTWH